MYSSCQHKNGSPDFCITEMHTLVFHARLCSIREEKTAAVPHKKGWSVYLIVEQLFPDYVYFLWHKTCDGRSTPGEYKPTR